MIIIISIAILSVALVTDYVVSGICADTARDKGYQWDTAFWLCFLLGITGCLLVISWPNLRARCDLMALEK